MVSQELQRGIEDVYSKRNTRKIIIEDIANSDFKQIRRDANKAINKYLTKSYYDSKNKRIRYLLINHTVQNIVEELLITVLGVQGQRPIQSITAKLGKFLAFEDTFSGVKTASELLAVTADIGLFTITSARHSETGSILVHSNYTLEDSTLQRLENMKYLPPMIVQPRDITNNSCSGYLTKDESVILGDNNHHEGYQAIDVSNILGKIPLSLDTRILDLEEKPKHDLDTPEKLSGFLRMIISSRKVYRDLIGYGNKFYLNWRFDKRGRVYSQGYHVNIQSTSFKKAIINLHKKEVIK